MIWFGVLGLTLVAHATPLDVKKSMPSKMIEVIDKNLPRNQNQALKFVSSHRKIVHSYFDFSSCSNNFVE